jgi:hypothetical protein
MSQDDSRKNPPPANPDPENPVPPEFFEPDEPWVTTGDWWLEESGAGLFDEMLKEKASMPVDPSVPEPDPNANPYRDILLTPEPDDTPLEDITAELDAIEQESGSGDAAFDPDAPAQAILAVPRPPVIPVPRLAPSIPMPQRPDISIPASPPAIPSGSPAVPSVPAPGAGGGAGWGTAAAVAAGAVAVGAAAAAALKARQHKEEKKGPAPAGAAGWFYLDQGKPAGPVPAEVIQQWIDAGQFPLESTVWREGLPSWLPARDAGFIATPPKPAAATPAEPVAAGSFCDGCGKPLKIGSRFCPGCGQPVAAAGLQSCPSCGAPRKAGAKFCRGCGNPLS